MTIIPVVEQSAIRVIHLTPQLSRAGGGASAYLWDLVRHTSAIGIENHVAGVRDQWTEQDIASQAAASIFAGAPTRDPAQGFSRELRRYLERDLPEVDLVHSHGLRNGIGLAALQVVRQRRIPLLISPHGMLYEPLLRRGRLKKWLVNRLWDNRYRSAAQAFHATSTAEAQVIRRHGAEQPVAVVPIGVDVDRFGPDNAGDAELEQQYPQLRGKKRLLFLGIMDRKKGLLRLAQAWGAICRQFAGWHLLIAGPDADGHRAEVEAALRRFGAADATSILGGVYGDEKARLYRSCDLFVLPSDWENFGIAIAEALASALPVIATRGAPWEQLQSHRCGWWIEPTPDALREALASAMQLSDSQRREMGGRGRELVETHYAWPAIAAQMASLYAWMLGRAQRPDFVQD